MRDVIMVFDVGTSSVKNTAVDVKTGELVALKSKTYPTVIPQEGYMELNPEDIWNAAQDACEALISEIRDSCHIHAISFSWFADDMLLVDEGKNPLTNIMLFFDSRAKETFEYFLKKNPAEICKKAGRGYSVNCEPMKVLWTKQNLPRTFEKAAYMFDNQQYIFSRLGLDPVNDDSMALFKCVEDVRNRVWAKDILDLYEIPETMCSGKIVSCCDIVGRTDHFGRVELPCEIPVFAGAHDELCGILGLGVLPGNGPIISDMMGTSNTINFLADVTGQEASCEGNMPIRTAFATYDNYGRGFPILGGALEWYARTYCRGMQAEGLFSRLFEAVEFDGKSNLLMVPWFGKHKVGIRGITSATTPDDFFRALIEGLCYECSYSMQYNDDLMLKVRGEHIGLVRVGGGGSQSDKWLQLRASMYGIPVQKTITPQACSVGAAVIAACGLGMYTDFEAASKHMVSLGKVFEPDPVQREAYMRKEPTFKAFHDMIMG